MFYSSYCCEYCDREPVESGWDSDVEIFEAERFCPSSPTTDSEVPREIENWYCEDERPISILEVEADSSSNGTSSILTHETLENLFEVTYVIETAPGMSEDEIKLAREFKDFQRIWATERYNDFDFFDKSYDMRVVLQYRPDGGAQDCQLFVHVPEIKYKVNLRMRFCGEMPNVLQVCETDGLSNAYVPAARWMKEHLFPRSKPGGYKRWEQHIHYRGESFPPLTELPPEICRRIFEYVIEPVIWVADPHRCGSEEYKLALEEQERRAALEDKKRIMGPELYGTYGEGKRMIWHLPKELDLRTSQPYDKEVYDERVDHRYNIYKYTMRDRKEKRLQGLNLLSVCSAVRDLAMDVILGPSTIMEVRDIFALKMLLTMMKSRNLCGGAPKRLALSFHNKDFFEFININARKGSGFAPAFPLGFPSHCAASWDDITDIGLKQIHFDFGWYAKDNYMSSYTICSKEPWAGNCYADVRICHNTLVDWFLTLIYDRLREIPTVTFSGDMSDSNRAKWTGIFSKQSDARVLNMNEDVARIKATPVSRL